VEAQYPNMVKVAARLELKSRTPKFEHREHQ
jgi:hypothetical protein